MKIKSTSGSSLQRSETTQQHQSSGNNGANVMQQKHEESAMDDTGTEQKRNRTGLGISFASGRQFANFMLIAITTSLLIVTSGFQQPGAIVKSQAAVHHTIQS